MTINEVKNAIMGISGATMARSNKTNFIAIPTDEGWVKIAVQTALSKDTKNHMAFNADAAIAEYKAWEAETALKAAERAARPKTVKGPNPEAQARRDELDAKIAALPSFTEYTATDIRNALGNSVADNVLVMQVGSAAKRLVEKGVLVPSVKENDKKTYYTKA